MASFYKNLKIMTKVEALRQAQLQLIRGNVNSELLARRGIGGVGKLDEVSNSAFQTPQFRSPCSKFNLRYNLSPLLLGSFYLGGRWKVICFSSQLSEKPQSILSKVGVEGEGFGDTQSFH